MRNIGDKVRPKRLYTGEFFSRSVKALNDLIKLSPPYVPPDVSGADTEIPLRNLLGCIGDLTDGITKQQLTKNTVDSGTQNT